MKIRLLFYVLLTLATTPTALAQEAFQTPGKDIVVVDFFLRNRVVPAPYVEMLRAEVINAFTARNRQLVIDAETERSLAASLRGTGVTDPLNAAADINAFLEERAPQAIAQGARYLVTGAVTDYKFEHAVIPSGDSRRPPVQGFKASFRIVIAAIDLRLGKRITDQLYELTATAPIAEEADKAALRRIAGSMDFYISNRFPIESVILQLCPPDKKGNFKELYIHSGHLTGVTNGDLFLVYEELPIGGVMTRQKIGKIRVNSASDDEVSKCKITAGAEEIADAFLNKRTLICISNGQALF